MLQDKLKWFKKDNPTGTLEYPRLSENTLGREFYESKAVKVPAMPRCGLNEATHTSARSTIVSARRHLAEATNRLRVVNKERKATRAKMDKRWADLEEKQKEFRARIVEYGDFVSANKEKRQRAKQKLENWRVLCAKRKNDIHLMEEKMEKFAQFKSTLEERIRDYKIYENFLYSVASPQYSELKNINHVMNRYSILEHAKSNILINQAELQKKFQDLKHRMNDLVSSNTMVTLKLSVDISDLWNRYNKAKVKCLNWELVMEKVRKEMEIKSNELMCIKMTTSGLYEFLCERRDVKIDENLEVAGQLEVITKNLHFFKQILRNLVFQRRRMRHGSETRRSR